MIETASDQSSPNRRTTKLLAFLRPPAGETPSLVSISATIISVSAIYLYFAGYIYSFFYFQGFGVTIESLDLSVQYYFAHAYTDFQSVFGFLLLAFLVSAVYAYSTSKLRQDVFVVLMIGAFPVLYVLSHNTAEGRLAAERCSPSQAIRLQFKAADKKQPDVSNSTNVPVQDKTAKTNSDIVTLSNSDKLFLLVETKDRIIVHEKSDCFAGPNHPSAVKVYTVSRSDLDSTVVVSP